MCGGRSSAGRAPDCGSGCRGFKSRRSPQKPFRPTDYDPALHVALPQGVIPATCICSFSRAVLGPLLMAFVAFEGLDHSGKSTLIHSLTTELKNHSIDFVSTREPGGTPLGEQIRKVVLDPYGSSLSSRTETLLICASRRDHIEKVIRPALAAGQWVLCDRFWASTVAFQGQGRGLPKDSIQWLNRFTVESVQPDLWVLLDLPVVEKEKRGHIDGTVSDRFEMQDRGFHQRVRECYLEMAKKEGWLLLNALLPQAELTQRIIEEFKKRRWLDS